MLERAKWPIIEEFVRCFVPKTLSETSSEPAGEVGYLLVTRIGFDTLISRIGTVVGP
jgi:hypothetical protein